MISGREAIRDEASMPTSSGGAGYGGIAEIIRIVSAPIGIGVVDAQHNRIRGIASDSVVEGVGAGVVDEPMSGVGSSNVPGRGRGAVAHAVDKRELQIGTRMSVDGEDVFVLCWDKEARR